MNVRLAPRTLEAASPPVAPNATSESWFADDRSWRHPVIHYREDPALALPSLVVFDIGESLVRLGRAFQRAAFARRLPLDDVLDLFRQFEILVGDAFGRVVHQANLDPGIGSGDVW